MAKEVEKRSGKATRQHYKKDRRETVIQVRMNAEELALLDGKRGGRTRSNYLRGALYGSAGSHTEHEVVADTPQLDRMLMELNRIGVNINQIARAFNARVKGMGMLEEIKMEPDKKAFEHAKKNGVNMHFMGLVSDGGVHSSLEHLFKLCDIAAEYKIENTFVHCFMDGRDTDPRSGKGFVADLEKHLAATTGRIATVIGRYYAMDRDKRWERVKIAYDALVNGIGERSSDMVEAVQKSYDEGVTDEFIKPFVRIDENGQPVGMIRPNDVVIFFNYRNDRAKELTVVLTQEDMPAEGMHTMPLYYCCMTPYDAKFTGLHILFDKENVPDTIGEWVSKQGLKQLRIAETEKYAHVTFFFNGGVEEPNEGEDRILVPSPKEVPTYDLKPEMSAPIVCDKLVEAIESGKYDVIIINFANPDMVGHTGVESAAIKAIETVDACVGRAVEAIKAAGGVLFICADHGNAEVMVDEATGEPWTAHTTNQVPFVLVGADPEYKLREGGRLCDIVPTLIELMGLEKPKEMTGESLLVK